MAGEEATLRTLEFIQREMRAAHAYLEFGGNARVDPTVISHALDEYWRVVVVFAEPVDQTTMRERLAALLQAFAGMVPSLETPTRHLGRPPAERRLDDELARLCELTGAKVALIIDEASPIIWGISAPRDRSEDVDFLLTLAKLTQRHEASFKELATLLAHPPAGDDSSQLAREMDRLRGYVQPRQEADWYRDILAARVVCLFRPKKPQDFRGRTVSQPNPVGYVAQALASQYLLLFVFDEPFSQLHAEGTTVHAVPYLERLIEELPPVDPQGGAKVHRMPRLKLV